jgi:acyl-[acyl-carrier-protein]-phospholipid O-acyltransferase / long-chain-fatty-acid--[acyl-carrier-protein] ligase
VKTILRHRGVGGLLFAQSQVAFNDNAIKLVLIGLVQMLLPASQASNLVSLIALLLVAPFVLFAPLTGWLADRFPHRDVLIGCLWFQLLVMGLLLAGTSLHSIPVAIGGFFLLGFQSALMGPARRGMIKDLARDNVGEVVGWMEMTCIAAILAGSLTGGQMIDGLAAKLQSPWIAAFASSGLLAVGCVIALIAFHRVPRHPAAGQAPFTANALFGHWNLITVLRRDRKLWRAAVGDSLFYLAGGILMLSLSEAGRSLHPDGLGAARSTGIMMALMGAGIAGGSVVAARLSRHRINLGLVPLGAAVMAVMLVVLATLPLGSVWFMAGLVALGIGGGMFLVPLGAFLVDGAPEADRGKILAASSMISSIAGIAAVGIYALFTKVLGLGLSGQFMIIGSGIGLVALASLKFVGADFLRLMALSLTRRHYVVRTVGEAAIPKTGGALLVCNHVSYVDTIALSLASARPIRFLSYEGFFQTPVLGSILRIFGAIPVSSTRAKEAIRVASEHIARGELVCIFPEGQLTRTGSLMELKSGFELIARRAQCPVIVTHLDGLWGSIFSFTGGKYFTKWPETLSRRVTVSFQTPLSAKEATTERVREIMGELGADAFVQRRLPSLNEAFVKTLRSQPWRKCLIDPSFSTSPLRAGALLGVAQALAVAIRKSMPGSRIGLLLPPGQAGTIANIAVLLAGKTPVNLNPTLGPEAARWCISQAEVEVVISTAALEQKFPKFPWPERVLRIENLIRPINHAQIVAGYVRSWWPKTNTPIDSEAALLFTSGSSGRPKGVALTHRHIMTNLTQVLETGFLRTDDRLLSPLPLFHCFGLTLGLFFPLLARKPLITAPSPLDTDKIAEAARQESPTVLLSTPTFLRGYAKRISRDAFGTLRLAVTGAEKLPQTTRAEFQDRFGCEVVEGYGLTEASPVAAINMLNPARGLGADSIQQGWRADSVGRLLPGLAARLLDPVSCEDQPGANNGLLALRGANIVSSYLGDEGSEKFRDGWFITGDIARIDPEGFVFIEGRTSRFSKIGGEMVSHTAVEEAIHRHMPLASGESAEECVMARACEVKGEELVLLTTRTLTVENVRRALTAAGVPNLWMPREIRVVRGIPKLASGKLDLVSCRNLAEKVSSV